MNKAVFIIITIIVLLGGVAYFSHSSKKESQSVANTNPTLAQRPNTVIINKYTFIPMKLTVKKGTTVTWINQDIAKHTVTADESDMSGLQSKLFGQNEKTTFTFAKTGTFTYHCEPHPYMKGIIEVIE